MSRNPDSHKGQNGRVMVVGGSELFHGAPLLAALGAEHAGADLVYPMVPACHAEVSKSTSLNFIVHTFTKNHLSLKDTGAILALSHNVDSVVIGPGLTDHNDTQRAVCLILKNLECPVVIDAGALFAAVHPLPKAVLTPHRGEFKALTGQEPTPETVQQAAETLQTVILCKGPTDIIAAPGRLALNTTGNALMTVGGTGDVLAGFLATLLAQGLDPFDAAVEAARRIGQIGDQLAKVQSTLRAVELARGLSSLSA